MIVVNEDPLVGYEDGVLFDGTRVEIGFDELDIETIETDSGYERITRYEDEIISKGNVTKEAWSEAYRNGHPNVEDSDLELAWTAEVAISQHSKILIQAFVDGVEETVERKLKRVEWVAR